MTPTRVIVATVVLATGCTVEYDSGGGDGATDGDYHGEGMGDSTDDTKSDSRMTVGAAVTRTCTTSSLAPLSLQIAAEVQCIAPESLQAFSEGDGITFSGGAAVIPYLAPDAIAGLQNTAIIEGSVQVVSAYRTVAQQYLIYRWYKAGRCGIPVAAQPGASNHESGRALDVQNWANVRVTLESEGWAHDVPGDGVHFTSSATSAQGLDVLAFQRLWNRNHPEDPIAEDADYGPQTADRLSRAPIRGFDLGASCL
jgi:hypothetical protein